MNKTDPAFQVFCLCAQWCGTCREYQPGFLSLAARYENASFTWIDIEEDERFSEEMDIENFPTLLIKRGSFVLYFGVMLPHLSHLQRVLESFMDMNLTQSEHYVHSSPERLLWQTDPVLSQITP